MQYKDTLELFDELVAAGTPEPQARAQARQLGAIGDLFGTELNNVHSKLDKIDKDLIWMRIIGAAMCIAFLSAWFK
jgi:hypothetical protein